ncbi:MAG: hypothetical protein L6Q29_00180 [Candidatus Pacebacteria bacterium]|nr:hypothetical protein [Candidatus Paceibacterota bacterium]NUQ57574.1 hypothetical protein [Candidatus Paceibacter sp.]
MQKIKVKFNKTAQQFFFLSNLSEWHFSCNPTYNQLWFETIGHLDEKEKKTLKKLKAIFKKYDFDDENTNHYLGKPFIDSEENDIWDNVSKSVSKKEFEELKIAFKVFEKKFNILWLKDGKKIDAISKKIYKSINDQKNKKFFKLLENLFGKINEIIVNIFIIPQKSSSIAGGANTKKGVITLEIRSAKDIKEGILMVLHELSHHLFRQLHKDNIKTNLSDHDKISLCKIPLFKEQGINSGIEEAVLLTLSPDGIFRSYMLGNSEKMSPELKKNISLSNRSDFENYIIYQTKEKILDYIKNKKQIDKNYINFVANTAVHFTKLAK